MISSNLCTVIIFAFYCSKVYINYAAFLSSIDLIYKTATGEFEFKKVEQSLHFTKSSLNIFFLGCLIPG